MHRCPLHIQDTAEACQHPPHRCLQLERVCWKRLDTVPLPSCSRQVEQGVTLGQVEGPRAVPGHVWVAQQLAGQSVLQIAQVEPSEKERTKTNVWHHAVAQIHKLHGGK